MNEQQQQNRGLSDFRTAMGWLAFICRSLAVSVEVFIHRDLGIRYLGLQAFAAAVFIFVYPGFWPGYDLRPMAWYLLIYLLCCVAHSMDARRRAKRGGPQPHSYYTGLPLVMRFTGRLFSEITIKRIIEPLMVFVIGALVMKGSEPLGKWLMLAAAGLLGSVNLSVGYEQTRARDMNDAAIESRQLAERFRSMHGDRN